MNQLYWVLKAATEIAPKKHNQPRYCGIHIQRLGTELVVEATDGNMLMQVKMYTPEAYFLVGEGADVYIPVTTLVAMLPKFKEYATIPLVIKNCIGEPVEITLDGVKIEQNPGIFVNTSRIISGSVNEPERTASAALDMKILNKITKAAITVSKAMGKISEDMAPMEVHTGTMTNPTSFRYVANGIAVLFLQSPIRMW
jgi:hypothetical protein